MASMIAAGAAHLDVAVGDTTVRMEEPLRWAASATLVLRADAPARWSVLDDMQGAWFPREAPHKWDTQFRPYFDGNIVELEVPATLLHEVVARGIESEPSAVQFADGLGRPPWIRCEGSAYHRVCRYQPQRRVEVHFAR